MSNRSFFFLDLNTPTADDCIKLESLIYSGAFEKRGYWVRRLNGRALDGPETDAARHSATQPGNDKPHPPLVCAADIKLATELAWRLGKVPTFLQIATTDGCSRWELKRGGLDDPAYWVEIRSLEAGYLLDVFTHLAAKTWVDAGELAKVMLPLFQAAQKRGVL